MTKIEKILIPTILLAAGAMCALWINAQHANSQLARALQDKQTELEEVDAARKGLVQANDQLQSRLSQVERAAAALKAAPLPIVVTTDAAEYGEEELLSASEIERVVTLKDSQAATIPTAQEIAEQKEREEARAQRDAERAQQREEFVTRAQNDLRERRAFFSQINTEGLAPEYIEAHEKLMVSLETTEALIQQMANPDLDREAMRDLGRELWGQAREMGGLMEMQREVLLNDYAELSLGLSREQTQEFMNYMETVSKMTSGSPMRGGGRGR